MRKKVFFVHGFWVQKDSRGMFPQIEESLRNIFPNIQFEYTELNHICENGKDTKVLPFSEQKKLLEEKIKFAEKDDFNVIIAHSQGCVISSLLQNIEHLSLWIFLTPPSESDFSILIERMWQRQGSFIDVTQESVLRRSDGSLSYIPSEYFLERSKLNYEELYKHFQEKIPSYLIQAQDDEIIHNANISKIWFKETFLIWWNHNFDDTSESRKFLLETLSNIIKANYWWKS